MTIWVLVSTLVLVSCQGDRSAVDDVAPTTAAPDRAAYCTLAKELAAKRLAASATATNDSEAQQLFQQFASDHLVQARQLEALAPAEIRKDVATVVQGLERVAKGETTAFAEKRLLVADGRVERYDATACASS